MGKKYNVIRTGAVARRFTCGCGAHADLTLQVRGDSGAIADWADPSGSIGYQAAGHDLGADAGRILGLVKCPRCGVRSTRGVAFSILRGAAMCVMTLIGAAVFSCGAPQQYFFYAFAPFAAIALLVGTWEERRRWREARRAVAGIAATEPLPRAVARAIPAAPLAPLRTAAPERVTPTTSDDGPSLLR